jgi:hypothetical protein
MRRILIEDLDEISPTLVQSKIARLEELVDVRI